MRVCVAVARRRKGKRVRERVCNKGDRRGLAGEGREGGLAKGEKRGRVGGWEKRGTAADLVLLRSPCARNINASHFSSRPLSDESVSLSLPPPLPPFFVSSSFSLSLSPLAKGRGGVRFLTRVNRRFSRV